MIMIPCPTEACMLDYHLALGSGKAPLIMDWRVARMSTLLSALLNVSRNVVTRWTCTGSIPARCFAFGWKIMQTLGYLLAPKSWPILIQSVFLASGSPYLGDGFWEEQRFWSRVEEDSRFPHGRQSHPRIEASWRCNKFPFLSNCGGAKLLSNWNHIIRPRSLDKSPRPVVGYLNLEFITASMCSYARGPIGIGSLLSERMHFLVTLPLSAGDIVSGIFYFEPWTHWRFQTNWFQDSLWPPRL